MQLIVGSLSLAAEGVGPYTNTSCRPAPNCKVALLTTQSFQSLEDRKMASCISIPTVDLSAFTTNSNIAARHVTAKKLAEYCALNGCVGITGHGVPKELLTQAFDMAKSLFDLPVDEKMKARHPKGPVPHRGYSAIGMEKAYTNEDLETNDAAHRDSLRKITDCKVRSQFLP